MGASDFMQGINRTKMIKTVDEAFLSATSAARYDHGHGGYTGTIAEKSEFVIVGTATSMREAAEQANQSFIDNDPHVCDKWGPAACIEIPGEDGGWLFFGSASS